MKTIQRYTGILAVAAMVTFASCSKDAGEASGSDSETTPNDSSGTVSRSALGQDEGKQKKIGGYPSNQSNLNSDSISRLHDDNDVVVDKPESEKSQKDKPLKHEHQ
ncbi:hypothetical protein DSL64_13355 [Dyadobacter luteus]|jgi:hypothetical protein|uniref:Lipoprotein n=1 Tax=Dyadobacter luteus TaxID=2259619 RepID=A0A3D8YAQ7_9BACT|nr:hypothetical protein [Dyadobacter luteus]REA60883.1 hypothetical protein DSL64_13355 [Dyadobacter luteus]